MFKFSVLTDVRIINNNECYVDDPNMVADHVKDHYDATCYCMSSQPSDGEVGQILARWQDSGQNIYYVRLYEDDECSTLSCYCYCVDEAGLEKLDAEIKEGDTVRVVNPGAAYADYLGWVRRHITDPDLLARWAYGSRIPENGIYEVVKIAYHSETSNYAKLAFIKDADRIASYKCYLIGVDGLAKVKPEAKQKKQHPLEF